MEERIKKDNYEEINFIPLIIFEKNIEVTDDGIEYLKSFINKVIKNNNNFYSCIYRLEFQE